MNRSALVALKPGADHQPLLTFAIYLARQNGLRLGGITILDRDLFAPPEPVPLGGMSYKVELDEARLAKVRQQMVATMDEFSWSCTDAGVAFSITSGEESLGPELAHAVQRFDLLLLGRPELGAEPTHLHSILRRCPRPAIVVPPQAWTGETVVVAYDASVQAARAVKSFVASDLERNSPVHVVAYHDNLRLAQDAVALCRDFLVGHGRQVFAEADSVPSGTSATELILAACHKHKARLLVMGAYGRSVIREFFFGSVTSRMLAEAPLPVFVDS